MKLSDNAMAVLKKRYLLTDENDKQETPEEMFHRVAINIAQAEDLYGGGVADKVYEFYSLMYNLRFIPNSPTLMNAGTDIQQLSACFVLPIEDSMSGIFKTLSDAALIFKSSGGVGVNFSPLRAKDTQVGNFGGTSSGPISFMEVYDAMIDSVKAGGRRRGAAMAVFNIDHPDIREFITCKKDKSKLNNFNVSIAITDKFMGAVRNNSAYNLVDHNGNVVGTEDAKEIFDMIVANAWETGEPGILFIDEINRHNPTPHVGRIDSTNPCLTGDMIVNTVEYGEKCIKDIVDEPVTLFLRDVPVKTTHLGFFSRGAKKVYKITTNGGVSVTSTLNHKWWGHLKRTGYTGWIKVEDMRVGDILNRHENMSGDSITSIEYIGVEEVYDCQVPVFNAYNAGLYISHNCAEIAALPYESCNLGSINIAQHIIFNDCGDNEVNWDLLEETIYTAVNFLDNVIDMNNFPLPEIESMTKGNRKIGLGVMGFADLLFELKIPYGSEKSFEVARLIMEFIANRAREASMELAMERGAYPNWKPVNAMEEPVRNATCTSIAPTGTISMIAGASSGIEPLFALVFKRTIMDGTEMYEVNPIFKRELEQAGLYSDELMERILEAGSIHNIPEIPAWMKEVFVTSHDVTPEQHVKMQAVFQEYVDNAISKTVNLPHNATKEDVANVYKLAFDLRCKGVTCYRDGCRDNQVLSTGNTNKQEEVKPTMSNEKKKRNHVLSGSTRKVTTGCGSLYITINENEAGEPIEVFGILGKSGRCVSSQTEALARTISLGLKSGVSIEALAKQLKGISCNAPAWMSGGKQILSCADAFSYVISEYLKDKNGEAPVKDIKQGSGEVVGGCPDCGGSLIKESGCSVCKSCGYSKCSG